MRQTNVVLIDVPSRYEGPIRHRCRELVFASTWEQQMNRGAAAFEGCALCVLGSDGDRRELARRVDRVRESLGDCPIVVIGGAFSVEAVVDLMRRGAVDVVSLPADPTELASQVLSHTDRRSVNAGQSDFVGSTPEVHRVRRRIRAVARTCSTVLLTGETGCGKGVVAREIHRLSERRERPFIHVDCGALASSVIDSELFGHERGAFTGAIGRHAGRFERAEGGTIFLDEIGDLDLALQSKLLRVLQEREYERLGGSRTQAMTARVIAATNRDLELAVAEGCFRADLVFRVRVIEISIPPLRERLDDMPALVQALLAQLGARLSLRPPAFSERFTKRLMSHDWPGNVRELMNLLERLLIEKPGVVLDDIDLDGNWGATRVDRSASRFGVQGRFRAPGATDPIRDEGRGREAIAAALRAEGGNVTRAARRLGLPRSTLRHRIRQLAL